MKIAAMEKKRKMNMYKSKTRSFTSWRFWIIYVCIFFALAALVAKFTHLQLIDNETLIKRGDMRSVRTQEVDALRGMITDRAGRILAVSVPVDAIWINPSRVISENALSISDTRWQALAEALSMPLADIITRMEDNKNAKFLYLSRQVNPSVSDYVRDLKLPGIGFEKTSKRYYPAGDITAHLIGFTDIDGKGIEGVEHSFDARLTGESGEVVMRRDRFGRVIEHITSVSSKEAQNISLSVDERLQTILYKELSSAVEFNKADSGSAVLLDIKTGEILAMVNSPSFNPNNRFNIQGDIVRNRAITDPFEPGSTVKPLVVMAALEQRIVRPNTYINTTPFRANNHEVKDVSWQAQLTPEGILKKSSNVGVSRLAMKMKQKELVDMYSRFGFGKSTDIGLVGESNGYNPVNKKSWSDIERATYSFGYGLMSTPLQLAKVYATIGSFGISRPVSIFRQDDEVEGERVFPEGTTRAVVKMMESVAEAGSGGARAGVRGYRVAVKTGTAKKVGKSGKYVDKYIAYTAGIAPASDPRYALVVVIDDPKAGQYYGGAVSAPVFSNIMGGALRTMNIQPDALPDNSIVINR